jgi:DNA-directed RNA polymerase sigma subunit (sigma70/sigma32)
MHKSVSIENVALSTQCDSDEVNTKIDTQNLISSALSQLDDRKKSIIQMRYAIGYDIVHTRVEIAKKFNICTTYVATLEHIALHKMRRMKTLLEAA